MNRITKVLLGSRMTLCMRRLCEKKKRNSKRKWTKSRSITSRKSIWRTKTRIERMCRMIVNSNSQWNSIASIKRISLKRRRITSNSCHSPAAIISCIKKSNHTPYPRILRRNYLKISLFRFRSSQLSWLSQVRTLRSQLKMISRIRSSKNKYWLKVLDTGRHMSQWISYEETTISHF